MAGEERIRGDGRGGDELKELEMSEEAAGSGLEELELIWQSARGAMRGPRARRRRTSRRRAMGEGGDELRELEMSEGAASS